MRIGLNLLHAMEGIGGGWYYIQNIVQCLANGTDCNDYFAFVTKKSINLVEKYPKLSPIVININPESRLQRILYENTLFLNLVNQYQIDVIHWFANTHSIILTKPSVVTIYDLLAFTSESRISRLRRMYIKLMMRRTAKSDSILLPMSRYTSKMISEYLQVDDRRMNVIPIIVHEDFHRITGSAVNEFREKYNLPLNFWLYVAHTYHHKNHVRLLSAYDRLLKTTNNPWPLVLRGDPNEAECELISKIKELRLEDQIVRLPRLEDKEMPLLYSSASALVFPSLFEGGGIPVLEAMACGCPVTASNIAAVIEYSGGNVLLFNPNSVDSILTAMIQMQDDIKLRIKLQEKAIEYIKRLRSIDFQGKIVQSYKMAYQRIK